MWHCHPNPKDKDVASCCSYKGEFHKEIVPSVILDAKAQALCDPGVDRFLCVDSLEPLLASTKQDWVIEHRRDSTRPETYNIRDSPPPPQSSKRTKVKEETMCNVPSTNGHRCGHSSHRKETCEVAKRSQRGCR